jgi:hypothetical protein
MTPPTSPAAPKRKARRTGLRWRLASVAIVLALVMGVFALVGRTIPLPVWIVAEVETRLNRDLAGAAPDVALALGMVDLTLDEDFIPRLLVQDLRLLKRDGTTLLSLPEVRISLQGRALLSGEARLSSVRIIGARLAVTRDASGSFDVAVGEATDVGAAPTLGSFGDLFGQLDRVLALPGLEHLARIEAEGLSVAVNDLRSGRLYELGDGRLTVDNRAGALAAELSVSLQGQARSPGRAVVQIVTEKARSVARITAQFNDISAADLAAQAPLLAPLASFDAAISGQLAAELGNAGVTALDGQLEIGKGALRPTPAAVAVPFDRAAFSMAYKAETGLVTLSRIDVESPTLRAQASGQTYLVDAAGARLMGPLGGAVPAAFVTQITLENVKIDPAGVFAEPVRFSTGALEFRLGLDPFSVEIGQFALAEDQRRLVMTGRIGADAAGWTTALDVSLNEISNDRLVALWPKSVLGRTRDWVGRNLLDGNLRDIRAALRLSPGQEPRLHLSYAFDGADVRFLRSLPPIEGGKGYSTIEGLTYTMVMTEGQVTAPQGGQIDMAGSVFAVPDVSAKPAMAEIRLSTRSSLTAALSLLNLPPFNFMTKADRPVDLGEGRAEISTRLTLPLQGRVELADVSYQVAGTVFEFASDKLVPKRRITAERLAVTASPAGIEITGPGRLGEVGFDVTYAQGFGPDQKGRSTIRGTATLSQKVAEEFGLGLPQGMVSGEGRATVEIDLRRGVAGQLRLRSDLEGIGLTLPELAWTKTRGAKGALEADVTLGEVPRVDRLALNAAGLKAEGAISLRPGGGLEIARFQRVTLDEWLDAGVELMGQGAGKPLAIALTDGSVDLRRMPEAEARGTSAAGQGGGPLRLDLDRLIVSQDIALTRLRGDFRLSGGFNGEFTALMNDGPEVTGTVVPSRHGTAVRLRSDDAGETFAAAGVFLSGRGGRMDMTLTPREQAGHYDGRVTIRDVRVRNASVLAELLNAISVVGLLEQLNGQGLVFNVVEGEFLLTPQLVDLRRGSATGASLGVSMTGVYQTGSKRLAMEGVISPVYLLNGVGAVLTRRGEGVFGFNYTLQGTAEALEVGVNPLSILTPGMLRGLFRGARAAAPESALAPDSAPDLAPDSAAGQRPRQRPKQGRD